MNNKPPRGRIAGHGKRGCLSGKTAAVLLFSYFPTDPRPRREAEALAAEGMEVDLICLRATCRQETHQEFQGINVFRMPLRRRRGSKLTYLIQYLGFWLWAFVVLGVRSLFRRYSIIHVHNMPDWLVFAATVPKLLGAKVVLDLHDPMPELAMTIFRIPTANLLIRLLLRLETWSIQFADLVLVPNISFRKLFTSRSCPAAKVHVIMNSPQENIFDLALYGGASHAGTPDRPFTLMYHGLLAERHGLIEAVRAMARVRVHVPNVKLCIYGEATPYLNHVQAEVRRLKLGDVIEYRGWKPLAEIARAISLADIGIIPNVRTPFTEINLPTRILEYLSMEKPVIAPRTVGIQDYFGEDELIYFEPGNIVDLANRIEQAYWKPAELVAVVRRGREVYRQCCWELERRKLTELIADLVAGAQARVEERGCAQRATWYKPMPSQAEQLTTGAISREEAS